MNPPTVAIQASKYGISWFCTPAPAIIWLGRTGINYPNSFELAPLECRPDENGTGADRQGEGNTVAKRFSLNRYYYAIETTLAFINRTP